MSRLVDTGARAGPILGSVLRRRPRVRQARAARRRKCAARASSVERSCLTAPRTACSAVPGKRWQHIRLGWRGRLPRPAGRHCCRAMMTSPAPRPSVCPVSWSGRRWTTCPSRRRPRRRWLVLRMDHRQLRLRGPGRQAHSRRRPHAAQPGTDRRPGDSVVPLQADSVAHRQADSVAHRPEDSVARRRPRRPGDLVRCRPRHRQEHTMARRQRASVHRHQPGAESCRWGAHRPVHSRPPRGRRVRLRSGRRPRTPQRMPP